MSLKFVIGAKQTLCCSMPQKLNSSTYQLNTTFQITISSSSMTQMSPSPTLNILGLSFTCNLNWKLHISLGKTASMKLGVLSRLCQFYSPPLLLTLYRGLIRPCFSSVHVSQTCFTCLGTLHSYSSIEQGGIESFSSYQFLPPWLTVFSFFLIAAMLPLLLFFTAIFMLTALLISLTAASLHKTCFFLSSLFCPPL